MKLLKALVLIIIGALIAYACYQNSEFFNSRQTIGINLFGFAEYRTSEFPNYYAFALFFLVGILFGYSVTLPGKFKSRKNVKNLNTLVKSHQDTISSLEKEIEAQRRQPVEQEAISEEETQTA